MRKRWGKRKVFYQRSHVLHWAWSLTFVITRVCLSNLANPLFFITVFFLLSILYFRFLFCVSVLSFVILFWVLWFCFEFCVSVLGFVILFWVLCFCIGFCDSVSSFVFLYWVLWFCFEFCVSVLGFVILFCSVSATVRFNIVTCCLFILWEA